MPLPAIRNSGRSKVLIFSAGSSADGYMCRTSCPLRTYHQFYKRYVDASPAPTRLVWSYDNRTAGFRVVGKGQSLGIECRIPAQTVTLTTLCCRLGPGIDGIRTGSIRRIALWVTSTSTKHLPQVPRTLKEAAALFENSEFARHAFGENVVQHYSHFSGKK